MNKQDIFIECIGIPGSGKTTTISIVSKSVKEGLRVYRKSNGEADVLYKTIKIDILPRFLKYMSRNLLFLFVLGKSVLKLGLVKERLAISKLIIEALESLYLFKQKDNIETLHIVDEGILQYIGSLVVHKKKTNNFIPEDLIKEVILKAINGIVFMKIPLEVAIERIKLRSTKNSRFAFMNEKESLNNLIEMNNVFFKCIEIAEKEGIPVLELNAENDVEIKKKIINNWLKDSF